MDTKQRFSPLIPIILLLIASLIALSAATYAWFAFDPYTNITPMEGTIADGDLSLLISEDKEKDFDIRCPLNPQWLPEELAPVSTADLTRFFTATAQDRQGYSTAFQELEDVSQQLIYGKVYLKCMGEDCLVYFRHPGLDLGEDGQFLASARLALRITGEDGAANVLLFQLDSLGDTRDVQSRATVLADNCVISGLTGTAPVFSADPAVSIEDYLMDAEDSKSLCSLKKNEVAQVEYWVYLEGCDPECYNPVQRRNLSLQLAFTGDPIEPEETPEA